MKNWIIMAGMLCTILSCNQKNESSPFLVGKVERDEIAVVGKIAGRIIQLNVQEGDFVRQGDTLAVLDIPELEAKKAQAKGAITSASAQYEMAVKGATENQLRQLEAKKAALEEQFRYAKKSLDRMEIMVRDSLIPQQQFDEVYTKYKGAEAQLLAVNAEIADVQQGVRKEQQWMALGQQDRAIGAFEEVTIAEKEKYILAPQDMQIEGITLKVGELALPGYTLFKGSLENSTYFRFTLPESQLQAFQKGSEITLHIRYLHKDLSGKIQHIRQLGSYANITTPYPDYDLQDPLYEMIVRPVQPQDAKTLLRKSTVLIQ